MREIQLEDLLLLIVFFIIVIDFDIMFFYHLLTGPSDLPMTPTLIQ